LSTGGRKINSGEGVRRADWSVAKITQIHPTFEPLRGGMSKLPKLSLADDAT
jgi:hypothetical protein